MHAQWLWGIGIMGGVILTWPIIRMILIFLLTLATGLFGALTAAVNTLPATPVIIVSPPAVSAPAQSGTAQPSSDTKMILDRFDKAEAKQDIRDDRQDQRIDTVATRVEDLATQLSKPTTPLPAASPPCNNNCWGRGEYLEIPHSR